MKIYISGPMTGLPDYNYPLFNSWAYRIRQAGFDVECPTEHCLPVDTSWAGYVRHGVTKMMTCDALATLPGWEHSKGARLEVLIAERLGMPIKSVAEWVA